MSTLSVETIPARYTSSVPIIDRSMINGWLSELALAPYAHHIKLSDKEPTAAIFSEFTDLQNDLAIWRRGITPPIDLFVSTALERMGEDAATRLGRFKHLWLNDNGQLVCGGQPVDPNFIVNLYRNDGMDGNMVVPFAEFFVDAIQNVLQHVPRQGEPRLTYHTRNINCIYSAQSETFNTRHIDSRENNISDLSS